MSLTKQQIQQIVDLYQTKPPSNSYPTQKELAKRFGVHHSTISYHLNKAGVSGVSRQGSNNRKLSQADIDKIIEIYTTPAEDGTWAGAETISEQFDVTPSAIRHHLHKEGVEVRNPVEAHAHGKRCKPLRRGCGLPPRGEKPPPCRCGCGQSVEWDAGHHRWYRYAPGHYHALKPYHDKDWLEREYVEKQRTSTDIAEPFGVDPDTILRNMNKLGIPRRSQAESLRLSGAARGPNNPAWRGGVADWDYNPGWKSTARKIRKRDNYTCQLCGTKFPKRARSLHVHHIDSDKTNDSHANLICLCAKCHHPLTGKAAEEIADELRQIVLDRNPEKYPHVRL